MSPPLGEIPVNVWYSLKKRLCQIGARRRRYNKKNNQNVKEQDNKKQGAVMSEPRCERRSEERTRSSQSG